MSPQFAPGIVTLALCGGTYAIRYAAALMTAVLALPGLAAGADFDVIQESILEQGVYVRPKAIARMSDGGYVIVGAIPSLVSGWATKTDEQGNPVWRYVLPPEKPNPQRSPPEFTAAAPMQDGAALLCGFSASGPGPIATANVAVLVRIDKSGKVLDKRTFYPKGDESFRLTYVWQCVPWGNGFGIVGEAIRFLKRSGPGKVSTEHSYWVAALDSELTVRWEELIPIGMDNIDQYARPVLLADEDLVFSATRRTKETVTELVRVTANGTVRARRKLIGDFMLVARTKLDSSVWVMGCLGSLRRGALLRLGEALEEVEERRVTLAAKHVCNAAYFLPDPALVLFGYSRVSLIDVASVIKRRTDLESEAEYLFPPKRSWWVDDAVLTQTARVFATVRRIQPVDNQPPAISLTIIRIN